MLAAGGRWRASTGAFLALSNPGHVADGASRLWPHGPDDSMPKARAPALLSLLADLLAVGGFCFGGM